MKPLFLSLEGFTAFRKKIEIDFSDLELFAIIGPTGSGKSSLLDAITFALYGQTARLRSTGLDSLISQGSTTLKTSFSFEIGGKVYRATRTIKIGRNSARKEVRLEIQDDSGNWKNNFGTKLSDINKQIEDVIGLSFEAFRKTVLLPQGEFSALIHGTPADRKNLLKDLIGLDEVEAMRKKSAELAQEENMISQRIAKEKEDLGDISEKSIEEIDAVILESSRNQKDIAHQIKQLEAVILELKEQQFIYTRLIQHKNELKIMESQRPTIEANAAKALKGRQVAAVTNLLDREQKSRLFYKKELELLKETEKAIESAQNEDIKAQNMLNQAEKEFSKIAELESEIENLQKSQATFAMFSQLFKRLRSQLSSPHDHPLAWNEDLYHDLKEKEQILLEFSEKEKELNKLQNKIKESEQTSHSLYKELQALIQQRQNIDDEGRLKRSQEKNAIVDVFRTELKIGGPCPVCLQFVNEIPQATDENAVKKSRELAEELNKMRKAREELNVKIGVLDSRIAQQQEYKQSLEQEAEELINYIDKKPIYEESPTVTIQRLLTGLSMQISEMKDPQKSINNLRSSIELLRKNKEKAQQALYMASQKLAEANTMFSATKVNAQQREEEWNNAREGLENTLASLQMSREEVKLSALSLSEINKFEEEAQAYKAKLIQLEKSILEYEEKLNPDFSSETLPEKERELLKLKEHLENEKEILMLQKSQRQLVTEKLNRKDKLDEELSVSLKKYYVWNTLQNTLKSNEFQQFMLVEIEQNLLAGASQLLKEISDERYELATQDGEYMVLDSWNAKEARSVKTLSGGETFLASLALAVSLSDYLAGNRRLGALFLDEGFGTLDPQALDMVATALENLRTTGRMIGVITHVESLSQSLPARLIVGKNTQGSSVSKHS